MLVSRRTGEITLLVTGSGELVAAAQSELTFQNGGDLLELNVNVGDRVVAGDVLARLQAVKTPAQLQAEITAAELSVLQAEQTLEPRLAYQMNSILQDVVKRGTGVRARSLGRFRS